MSKPHVLIVDDEKSIRLALETGLSLDGFSVSSARSGREAISAARSQKFDVVVCDIFMPDGDGLDFVRELRAHDAHTPVILITAQGSLELAMRAVSDGATDFIAKPFEVGALAELLRRSINARREADNPEAETDALLNDFSRSGLIGRSPAMVTVYKLIAHAARSDATVLITGESGTGKELAARAVHSLSSRANRPFIAVNCSGLTDTLLEAELFGHTRGAFTGATSDREGLFEAAEGGVLFLDELASTSATFQAGLLRVLQSGEVRRVGSTQTRRVNARVIGASNAPLREMVAAEKFRADLFYRLSVLTIDMPLRGSATRRLFYGVESSILFGQDRVESQSSFSTTVGAIPYTPTQTYLNKRRVRQGMIGLGIGFALRKGAVLSLDLSTGRAREDSLGQTHFASLPPGILAYSSFDYAYERTSFKAGRLGGQTDVWRNLFAGGALFYIYEWNRYDLREKRKLFSFNGGWRLTPRWITQYSYFSSYSYIFGGSPPSHTLMLRYEFGRPEKE